MTPRRMNTVLIAILALLVVGAGGFVFFANDSLTKTAQHTSRLMADIEVAEKQIKTYSATKQRVESLGYVNELAAKVLPDSEEQSVVVTELSTFAQREELVVSGIEFVDSPVAKKSSDKSKKDGTPKDVEVVSVVMKLKEVPYNRLLKFLDSVEGNQRKMQITNLSLKPDEDDREVLTEVSVALNLYVKKAAAEEKKS